MVLIEQMKEYEQEKALLELKAKKIKLEFESYISDKSISLIERWKFFTDADDSFKNHEDWIIDGRSKGMKYFLENGLERYMGSRGKRLDTKDLFGECCHHGKMYPDNFCYGKGLDEKDAEKLLIQALEEVLDRNIDSFCYDW